MTDRARSDNVVIRRYFGGLLVRVFFAIGLVLESQAMDWISPWRIWAVFVIMEVASLRVHWFPAIPLIFLSVMGYVRATKPLLGFF